MSSLRKQLSFGRARASTSAPKPQHEHTRCSDQQNAADSGANYKMPTDAQAMAEELRELKEAAEAADEYASAAHEALEKATARAAEDRTSLIKCHEELVSWMRLTVEVVCPYRVEKTVCAKRHVEVLAFVASKLESHPSSGRGKEGTQSGTSCTHRHCPEASAVSRAPRGDAAGASQFGEIREGAAATIAGVESAPASRAAK